MRYRPAPGLMSPRQTPHAVSSRECARFTALVLFASISCVDMLPGLDVLMVSGADDWRRTRGRAAVGGAVHSEGRQRGQHYAHSCGEERHCLHCRGCVSSHRPTSGESFKVCIYTTRAKGVRRADHGNVAIVDQLGLVLKRLTGRLPGQSGRATAATRPSASSTVA